MISIIIPSYNRATLIGETLQSIKDQTSGEWECIIVDDHSTDNTDAVVEQFIKEHPGNHFRYLKNERAKGAQGARNTGLDHAQGEYLIFLDSDDLLKNTCVEHRLNTVNQNPGFDYYCFATQLFNKFPGDNPFLWNKLNTKDEDYLRYLQLSNVFHTSGVLWKRQVFLDGFPAWDEKMSCYQDWDIYFRLSINKNLKGWKSDNKDVDSFYRKGDHATITKGMVSRKALETKKYLTGKVIDILKSSNVFETSKQYCIYFIKIFAISFAMVDPGIAAAYFEQYAKECGMGKVERMLWTVYLSKRFDSKYPKLIRAGFEPLGKALGQKKLIYGKFMCTPLAEI